MPGLPSSKRLLSMLTLAVAVSACGGPAYVRGTDNPDLDKAFNEVRDEMIRQLTDMKTKNDPRSNKHLREVPRS